MRKTEIKSIGFTPEWKKKVLSLRIKFKRAAIAEMDWLVSSCELPNIAEVLVCRFQKILVFLKEKGVKVDGFIEKNH